MKFVFTLIASLGEILHHALIGYMQRVGAVAYMQTPTAADFQAGRVTNPNQSEVIRQSLYDFQLYPLAGTAQLNFFSQPAGQGVTTALGAVVGSAKTLWDTNLVIANTLPSGAAFMIESIEVLFYAGLSAAASTFTPQNISLFAAAASAAVAAQVNDVNTLMQSGLLELNVLQKNYLRETPLHRFPPKTGIDHSSALASNSATVGEIALTNARAVGRPYYVDPVITLQPAVNFEIVVRWPAAVPVGSGFNGRIGIVLDGFTMRASQ